MELENKEKMRAGIDPKGLHLLLEGMAAGGEEENKMQLSGRIC